MKNSPDWPVAGIDYESLIATPVTASDLRPKSPGNAEWYN
jgi:hypothetical protein